MKAAKVGYIFVLTILLTFTTVLAIAAFYPAPKRYDYPVITPAFGDFNSPEYKAQQEKYNQDLQNYQTKNKDVESQRKIWGENVFITCLAAAILMAILGLLLLKNMYFASVSLLFGSFTLLVFGPGLASYFSDSTTIPIFGATTQVDVSMQKKIQFIIAAAGTLLALLIPSQLSEKNSTA